MSGYAEQFAGIATKVDPYVIRFSPKKAMNTFCHQHVQDIMNNKALREDIRVIAIKTNYCNCLFNCYKYDDAIIALKKLVVILEGQVISTY